MKLTNREITEQISGLSELCVANSTIDQKLYDSQHVFRGLRDLQGNGVVTGLTEISTVTSFADVNGEKVPCEGELRYRGININDIVNGFLNEDRFGVEINDDEIRGFTTVGDVVNYLESKN